MLKKGQKRGQASPDTVIFFISGSALSHKMQPQPFATEVHYDWLKQRRDDAQLSDAEPLLLEPLNLESMSPEELLAMLTKYGVAVIRGHDVESAIIFEQAKRFFAMVPAVFAFLTPCV